jgi:hypothetical protein
MDNSPKPSAETATSAMRLRVVFVDICFLSLVVKKNLFFTAGEKFFSPRDAMHVLLHHIPHRVSGRGEEN